MIDIRKRLGWLSLVGLALVLMSILAFLFARSSGHSASSYFENVATVRQLKQLDASWELDMMRSKMGINAHYDSLVDPLTGLNELHNRLGVAMTSERHDAASALIAANRSYGAAIEEKTRLIERFKSRNSVLRNSLAFLPTAAGDARAALESYGGVGSRTANAIVNSVLLDATLYSQGPSDEATAGIESDLARLSQINTVLPGAVRDSVDIFISHTRTVLREQPRVDALLRSVAAVPTAARIDELDALLAEERRAADRQILEDRQYLLIFSTALVALFLFAAIRLIRSHAEINRVNRQLHEANEGLERRVEERTRDLRAANTKLSATQNDIRNLLDNSGQGFLSIGADLLVGDQSSAACANILGGPPAGKPIVDLLCPQPDRETGDAMTVILESLFGDSEDFMRELKIELLPTRFRLGGKTVTVEYKFLADAGRLMLILTDVTHATQLADAVDRERKRLEMIVLAVTEGEAFTSMVNDYRKFLSDELPPLIDRVETSAAASELRRRLHTYKGLLAQFSFHHSPYAINEAETRFSAATEWTARTTREAIRPDALHAELERDLAGAANVLGHDFYSSGRRVLVSQRQLQGMERIAVATLTSGEGRSLSPPLRLLLQTLASLGMLDVKSVLVRHGRSASPLAARLQKQLSEIRVEGDDVGLPPERYADFFRSLVHVFRNAADHGVETPDEREAAGKPAEGSIRCNVRRQNGSVEITIEDDGAGVDRVVLESKLVSAGESRAKVESLSLAELVFREGLSSRSVASDISGRGVGLAAVKVELDRLGGSAAVESKRNVGTRFLFTLPMPSQISAVSNDAADFGRIAS